MSDPQQHWITRREAAKILHRSYRQVCRYCDKGLLHAKRFPPNRQTYVPVEDVLELQGRIQAALPDEFTVTRQMELELIEKEATSHVDFNSPPR